MHMSDHQVQIRRAGGETDASTAASIMAGTDPWKRLGRRYDDKRKTPFQVEVGPNENELEPFRLR